MTDVFTDRFIEPVHMSAGQQIQPSVKSISIKKRSSNWLLRSLFIVSGIVHAFIFMHISGLYRSKAMSYIEFAMRDTTKKTVRDIPKPRTRSKTPPPPDTKRLKVRQQLMRNINIEPAVKDLPDSLMEGISIPDVPDISNMKISDWYPGAFSASRDFITFNDYYEMVRLKIEGQKKYPDIAKRGRLQGHVTVCFVITNDGSVKDAEVLKTSSYKMLDVAALKAVQDAAPFPRPPKRFFKGPVSMELTIAFEII